MLTFARTFALLFFVTLSLVDAAMPPVLLYGTGSSLVAPLLATGSPNWFGNYTQLTQNLVTFNYSVTDTGMGQAALLNRAVDFAAVDTPLSAQQYASISPGSIFHVPLALTGEAVVYNIPPQYIKGALNLTGVVLAQIYKRLIRNWNDPNIVSLNPGLTYSAPISLVARSDASGSTFAFTTYLTATSSQYWDLGAAEKLVWPTATTLITGSVGMAKYVGSNTGTIGYVGYGFALNASLPMATLMNAASNYVTLSPTSIQQAATNFAENNIVPNPSGDWSSVVLVNQPGSNTWPISAMSYLLIYTNQTANGNKGSALAGLVVFINTNGAQQLTTSYGYVPLPEWALNSNAGVVQNIVLPRGFFADSYYNQNQGGSFYIPDNNLLFSLIVFFGIVVTIIGGLIWYYKKRDKKDYQTIP